MDFSKQPLLANGPVRKWTILDVKGFKVAVLGGERCSWPCSQCLHLAGGIDSARGSGQLI